MQVMADPESNSKFTILAHTHYPFIHSWNDKWLINPGSVGQPRDFGNIASQIGHAELEYGNYKVYSLRKRVLETRFINDPPGFQLI